MRLGKFPEALHDGHNIFMCYVCDDCKSQSQKVATFRRIPARYL